MPKKPIIMVESAFDEARQAWVYRATGKLIGSDLCYEFLDEARGRITDKAPHVVVDMSRVTMLNSTGIGIVASLCTATDQVGGKVYLTGASRAVERPLSATHMWGMIVRCASLDVLPAQL
jgi:anti-anti-sigma factor